MIRIVTDSNSQIPAELIERFGVTVVPITVTVDGTDYSEGVDLDADGFWEHFVDEAPAVTTSQPSPGAFAEVYRQLKADGVDEVVSIHVGSAFSGTANAARLGAETVDLPIRVVDSGTLSFGISCCVWEAATALADGRDAATAAARAESTAESVASTFIVQALDFAAAGGRWVDRLPANAEGIEVLTMGPGDAFASIGKGTSVDELCDLMANAMSSDGHPIRAAVGIADRAAAAFGEGLEERLRARSDVIDLVRYRVGPSVGAHTGPGTAGGFWYPCADA